MTADNRPWHTPELTALVRGKPEEAVLTACKSESSPGDFATTYRLCYYPEAPTCETCEMYVSS
jgi:hypothetical protein